MPSDLILIGAIAAAHGVRGQVKIRSFASDPENIFSFGPLFDKTGKRQFVLHPASQTKDAFIVSVEGITTREAAEALRGTELYIPRSALPSAEEGEFYQRDLIGMQVKTESGEVFGTVKAFHNFGAGELVEIALAGGDTTELLHFSKSTFPKIDVAAKTITIHPPEYITDEEPPE